MPQIDLIWKALHLPLQQRKVLKLLITDLPDKEIANRLNISPKTENEHSRRICEKFGVSNRVGLILLLVADSETLKALDNL